MFLDSNLAEVTESVSSPRSRSNRSSARSRPRSAAAAGSTSARATVRSGNAPAGDASRDERTLDLFGDPVLEPGERVPAAARDEAGAQAEAAVDVADDVASGRQAALDGFSAPDGLAAAGHVEAAEGAVTPEVATVTHAVSSPEGGGDANVDVVPASGAAAMTAVDIPWLMALQRKPPTCLRAMAPQRWRPSCKQPMVLRRSRPDLKRLMVKSRRLLLLLLPPPLNPAKGDPPVTPRRNAVRRRAANAGRLPVQAKRQRSNPRRSCRALARCRRRPGRR